LAKIPLQELWLTKEQIMQENGSKLRQQFNDMK
jgi:hypothetical protein